MQTNMEPTLLWIPELVSILIGLKLGYDYGVNRGKWARTIIGIIGGVIGSFVGVYMIYSLGYVMVLTYLENGVSIRMNFLDACVYEMLTGGGGGGTAIWIGSWIRSGLRPTARNAFQMIRGTIE